MECNKHRLKNDYLFCLDRRCVHRLACIECSTVDQKHSHHKYMIIDQFLQNDQDELTKVFDQSYDQIIGQSISIFMDQFNKQLDQYIDQSQQRMKQQFELLLVDMHQSIDRCRQQMYSKLKLEQIKTIVQIQQAIQTMVDVDSSIEQQQKLKEQIDMLNQTDRIQKQLNIVMDVYKQSEKEVMQQIMKQVQQTIEQQQQKQDQILEEYIDNVQELRDMRGCENQVNVVIDYLDGDDEYKQELQEISETIEYYEQNNQQYRIFVHVENDADLEICMKFIDMINDLGANYRVGELKIMINQYIPQNNKIIQQMINKYPNVYSIHVDDQSEQNDQDIHLLIKQLVSQSKLLQFVLIFDHDQYSYELLKEYNQLISSKKYLESLRYDNSDIKRICSSREHVQKTIEYVNDML